MSEQSNHCSSKVFILRIHPRLAGCSASEYKNGNVVHPEDAGKQAEFIYESLEKILQEAGATLDDVVKTTVYLTDMNDFAKVSPVRNKYFKNAEPASTLIEVSKLVKEGCRVEIEVIAVKQKTK